ncbi:ATP synthase F1 subunit epsilon [Buchnera aphidicola]|uniref:ATP synthase F1 subunit epsilon n=1 Tax=Buchnera aphidicola TaxID=9 RepID=UPI003463D77F
MYCFLNIVTYEKLLFSDNVKKIYITSIKGVLNIYPGHSPLLTMIHPGLLLVLNKKNKKIHFYVEDGILEVQPKKIIVLSSFAILVKDLNYSVLIKKKEELNIKIELCNDKNNIVNLKHDLFLVMKQLSILKMIRKN